MFAVFVVFNVVDCILKGVSKDCYEEDSVKVVQIKEGIFYLIVINLAGFLYILYCCINIICKPLFH